MNVFELMAKISLDTTEYNLGLDSIKNGAAKIGSLGAKAFAAATAAVGAFAVASVRTGMNFDSAMSQVAATMGKTVDQMMDETGTVELSWGTFTGNLRDYAQEMGANTVFSATQAAEALNYMALAGYDTEKSMKTLPSVLNLAAAGSMDLARASDMVTDAETALGLANKETADGIPRTSALIDEMARTASKTNTSVSQLGSAILTIGGTAKLLNGGMVEMADGTEKAYDGTTELSTALGLLADNGIKGSAAGTSLRNILSSLSSGKFEKTFGALGVSAYDSEGKMRSLKDILADMNKQMEGMTDQEKTGLINSVFNQRDLKSINALLATTGDRWDEITVALLESQGAAEEMAETQLDNLAGDVQLFKSAVEGAQIAVSDGLTPSLRDFVQIGTAGISEFTEKLRAGDIEGAMTSIGASIGNALTTALTKIPDLVKMGGLLLAGIGKGIATAASKIDLKSDVVPLIVSLAAGIRENASLLVSGAGDLIMSLADGIEDNSSYLAVTGHQILTSLWGAITDNAPVLFDAALDIITNLGQGIGENLPQFLEETALPLLLQFSETLRSGAGQLVDTGINFILNIAQGIMDSLPTLIEQVPQIVINIAGVINDNAPKLLVGGVKLIGMLLMGILQSVPTILANIPKIFEMILAVWSALNWINLGKQVISFIKNGIELIETQLPTKLQEIGQKAIDWFKGVNWANAGRSAITFIHTAITNVASLIPTILKTIGSTAIEWFKSVDWVGVGSKVINFILNGIKSVAGIIADKLRSIGEDAWDAFSNINWFDLGSNVISGIVDGLRAGVGWITDAARSVAQKAKDAAENLLDINSPSKVFRDEVGLMISKGLAIGIDKGAAEAIESAENLSKSIMQPFNGIEATKTMGGFSDTVTETIQANNENLVNGLYAAMSAALGEADFRVEISNREFGRILREAGAL